MIPHSRPIPDDAQVRSVVEALRRGHLAQGEEVSAFERDVSAAFGLEAVGVSSGTAALYLALKALNVGKGHRVAIPSYTCPSLYAAVSLAGAAPVCADVEESGVCVSAATVAPLLDDTVRAVIVPHMFGFEAAIQGILDLGCPVIEDCAQSVGGQYPDGRRMGTRGHIAIFSLYATKLVPAGEGGVCLTRDGEIAARIRRWRNSDEQTPDPTAFNFKLSDIHAALARASWQALPRNIEQRARLARRYDRTLGRFSFALRHGLSQPVCFRYLAETEGEVEPLLRQAEAIGIRCRKPVWAPLHRALGGSCPRADRLDRHLLSVPLYPGLSDEELERIETGMASLLEE